MSFLSKPTALQPGWINPISMSWFSVPPNLTPVILADGHGTLPTTLNSKGAVRASVHQDDLTFKLAPGHVSWKGLTPSKHINNILRGFCRETEAKSQENYLKRW